MSIASKPLPGTLRDPLYPEEDNNLMGETDFHMLALILLRMDLDDHFRPWPDIYVASDMFWYYRKGDPRAVKSPDVMVVKGVGKHKRISFRSWEEKAIPRVTFEIVSEKTWVQDMGPKKLEYERQGVVEYFVFDPEACYIDPPFQGFRLEEGHYASIPAGADGSLLSQELGLHLMVEGEQLRLIDAATREKILNADERKDLADARADQEKQRADALEAELARLRAAQSKAGQE